MNSEKLDLLIVNAGLSNGSVHGIQVCLANELTARGYRVGILSLIDQGPLLEKLHPDILTFSFKGKRSHECIRPMAALIDQYTPRAVLSGFVTINVITAFGSWWAKSKHRLVLCEHNHPFKLPMRGYRKRQLVLQWLAKFIYRPAYKVVCVSKGLIPLQQRVSRLPDDRYMAIYDPVVSEERTALSYEESDHKWFNDHSVPLIVSIGILVARKNHEMLIRAFARLRETREARLVILSEGPERPKLEQLVQELGMGDDIDMPGWVPNQMCFLRRADLFALATNQEGLCDVIIEALACGTTVVTTDCPTGPAEILNNGEFGTLVQVGDEVGLAEAMAYRLDNPLPSEPLIARAQDFTVEKAVSAYEHVLFGDDASDQRVER